MMNPELKPFLQRWNSEWSSLKAGASPADRRAHFEIVAKAMRLPTPEDVDCETTQWVESKSGDVRVRIFRHNGGGVQPCLIYMHGGAWMQGSPETHWDITARLASWAKMTVVSVDYAKAPERPYPAAFDQVVAVANWVRDQAARLEIDPAQISIGGDSAGGNLAAAAALALRGVLTFNAQVLIYPACDFDQSRASYKENPDGPIIQVAGMDAVNAMYCPNAEDLVNPFVAPLHAESHANLPPAFIAVAEHDPLRDSGLAYAEALEKAGVAVALDRGAGLIHGYLRAMDYCADSMAKLRLIAGWLAEQNA